MLFYICYKDGVRKNSVVHAIEMGYVFLLQNFDLVITTPVSAAADNIGGSTIHIYLAISVKKGIESQMQYLTCGQLDI